MPGGRPRGNSCKRGVLTQVGLSREVGGRKDFTEDGLTLLAGTHRIFIRSPFGEGGLYLKSQRMPGGLACVNVFAHMHAQPILFWGGLFIFRHKPMEKVRKSCSKQSASTLHPMGQEKADLTLKLPAPSGFLVPESQP